MTPGALTAGANDRVSNAPLNALELRRLSLAARLPLTWTASPRRRRLLLLSLAAPGFLLVATTPMHRLFVLMGLGAVLFALAMVFRRQTEPVFVRAEAADLWPPLTCAPKTRDWETPHA